jgi:hypothetical protein
MCNLNIDYILLPSYSWKKDYSNWRFDDWLPKDSIVNGMVFNEEFWIDLIKDSWNLSLFKVSCY